MYYVRTLRHPFRVLAGRQGQGLVHTAVEGHDISPLSLRCTDEQSAAGGPYTQLTGLDLLVGGRDSGCLESQVIRSHARLYISHHPQRRKDNSIFRLGIQPVQRHGGGVCGHVYRIDQTSGSLLIDLGAISGSARE